MASDTVSENIGELSNGRVLIVEWKIRDFLSLPYHVNHRIQSPSFHFEGAEWYLRLYPNGENESDSAGYIDICLMKQYSDTLIHQVNYHVGISKNDGSVYISWRAEGDIEGNETGRRVFRLVKRSVFCNKINELATNGVVTFFCYLQVKSEGTLDASTQTVFPEDITECNETKHESPNADINTGLHKLANNLKDLLLSKEECDITLKVNNQEFQAHKAILVARSSVFSSMFRHEMAEKLSGEVKISDCDPDAFHIYLTYLYTGTVKELSNNNVFNLYTVANKYDAIELMMICTEYMKTSLSVETVCDVITHYLLHNESELLEMASDFFSKQFKDIILTVKWQRFLIENPTTANELLIKASKYHVPPK